ncbi:MAG TPA: hypothetical protein VNH64_00880, partial [Parvularculaceae bacterium]|nr:hypothetical protein [Parvularculaceae bacterium]
GDVHVLWIDPHHPDVMICGNDGGASISQDGGESWSAEDNQPTAQFYHVAIDDQFPFHLYGAQQDRGSIEIASRSIRRAIGEEDTSSIDGGESGFVVPVPGEPWITYAGGYDGALTRYDRRTQQSRSVDVWPDNPMGHAAEKLKYRFQWTYPIVISRYAPHAIYVGSQYVLRSTDGGASWTSISPDLTRDIKAKEASSGGPLTQDNTSVEYYGTVFALAESPVKQGVLWAGSDDGLVHVSTDDGGTWKNVTPSGLPDLATISLIDPSHFDAGTAFLAARRYRQDDFAPYLYVTHDYGAHWRKITNGQPDNESSFAIRQDTQDKNLLFAGSLDGVYVSFDGGEHWQSLQLNLPHAPVRDMAIHDETSALAIATHGRAFWILDDLAPLRQMSAEVAAADHHLFAPQAAYLTYGSGPGGDDDEGASTGGENPSNGVIVYYALKKEPAKGEKVSLTFATEDGTTIASFSNLTDAEGKPLKEDENFYAPKEPKQSYVVRTEAGMNRFVWNMRYPDAAKVPEAIIWAGSMSGPRVAPGQYQVTLTVGKAKETQKFIVRADPRITASQADLEAQLALLKEVHAKLDAADHAILKLRKVRSQINTYVERLGKDKKEHAAIKDAAKAVTDKLDAVEAALIQTKSHASEDPLNYPIRLNNKLAALASEIGNSFARPTAQDAAVYADLKSATDAQLQTLDAAMTSDVPALNQKIEAEHLAPITVDVSDETEDDTADKAE